MKLLTTAEERARWVAAREEHGVEKYGDLARDINTLLDALIAEKRAHAEDLRVYQCFAESKRLLSEADSLERLKGRGHGDV